MKLLNQGWLLLFGVIVLVAILAFFPTAGVFMAVTLLSSLALISFVFHVLVDTTPVEEGVDID